MWTKGMIMIAAGIGGLILTFIWIIILWIKSRKQDMVPVESGSAVYAASASDVTDILAFHEKSQQLKSQQLKPSAPASSGNRADATELLDEASENVQSECTEVLNEQKDFTELL